MNKKKILIIIPAYNESGNIKKTIESIVKYKIKYDYIVINDGSTDNTEQILKDNNYNFISLTDNLGIGGAMQTGYKYAYENNYDITVQYDGDGQHDINYIQKIIDKIGQNNDMVIGSRFIEEKSDFKSTKSRQLGIKLISYFIKLVTKKRIYDTTSGFRGCNRKLIEYFSENYPIEYPEPITTTEVLKKGFKVAEIPVEMHERKEGKSSINSWKNVYYMINVILSIILIGFRRGK